MDLKLLWMLLLCFLAPLTLTDSSGAPSNHPPMSSESILPAFIESWLDSIVRVLGRIMFPRHNLADRSHLVQVVLMVVLILGIILVSVLIAVVAFKNRHTVVLYGRTNIEILVFRRATIENDVEMLALDEEISPISIRH